MSGSVICGLIRSLILGAALVLVCPALLAKAPASLLCPHRIIPTDVEATPILESAFTAEQAKASISRLAAEQHPADAASNEIAVDFLYVEGYLLKLRALYRQTPNAHLDFCRWLDVNGYFPE